MIKEIKKSLMFYGGTYTWVKNDLENLAQEALVLLNEKGSDDTDRAAYCIIDRRF